MITVTAPELASGQRKLASLEVPEWVWKAAVEYIPDVNPKTHIKNRKKVQMQRYRFCKVVMSHHEFTK